MGNGECCGRLKDDEDKFLMGGDQNLLDNDQMPLQWYDIKPYAQVINNMSREKIKFDDLIKEFNLEKGSDQLSKDSILMKFLNILPGKVPQKKVYPRVSLICLGILVCDGTHQDKADVMFNLMDPDRDANGSQYINLEEWHNSNIFEIIVAIAMKVKPEDDEKRIIIDMMKNGQYKNA